MVEGLISAVLGTQERFDLRIQARARKVAKIANVWLIPPLAMFPPNRSYNRTIHVTTLPELRIASNSFGPYP